MPAGLPGDDRPGYNTGPAANPSAGRLVIFDPLSGVTNSPFDAKKIDYTTGSPLGWSGMPTNVPIKVARTYSAAEGYSALSTGALSTGIGYGSPPIFGPGNASTPKLFADGNFTDDYIVGADKTDSSAAPDSTYMYIGGGKSNAAGVPVPYTAGFGIAAAGNGQTRDNGTGPGFQGAPIKTVTAAGSPANGAAIEPNWFNRSGIGMVPTQSAFGVGDTFIAAPAEEEPIP